MKLLWFLTFILIFLTPLIFVSDTNEAFEFPKMFFVYFAGTSLIFVYLLRLLWLKEKFVFPNVFVQGFLLANVLATLLSTHLYTSLWGYYSRFNGGLISLVVFIGVFLVLKNSFDQPQFSKIRNLIMVTILPIGGYGVVQHFTIDDITRVYSTLGQPNWLGAYLVVVLPLVMDKYFDEKLEWLSVFLYVLGFSALWYTFSLSALLGFVFAAGTFVYLKWDVIRKNVKKSGVLVAMTFLIALSQPGVFGQRVKDIMIDLRKANAQTEMTMDPGISSSSAPSDGEQLSASETSNDGEQLPAPNMSSGKQLSDPGFIRLLMWKGTLHLATSSPKNFLIGTGPETFPYTFQKYRPAELNYSSEWEFILNKPHNYYLEVLAETGIVGLFSYLCLLYWGFKNSDREFKASLVGFAVTNFFGWPTVATTLLFWVILANASLKTEPKG